MGAATYFPVGAPIRPETRQIGRAPTIDALHAQVVVGGQHTLMLADRRVGKTSMAWAILDRVRGSDDAWALEVDLSRGPIFSSALLADRLAEQARAAQIRIDPRSRTARKFLHDAAERGHAALQALARLGGDESPVGDASVVADIVVQALAVADGERADLRTVLAALRLAAEAGERRIVCFLDEAQRLETDWESDEDSRYAQAALAELMEDPAGNVVLLLAGSERSAIEQLLAEGQPLHHDGLMFDVPPISDEDWHHGLSVRFREAGLTIDAPAIDQILAASDGHPQRTMRICAHVHQLAVSGPFQISDVLVAQAIATARSHPSWPQ